MNQSRAASPGIAIACGGTGGHLFPGLAVAEQLSRRGCRITLLVSPREVDQLAVKSAAGMEVVRLPVVALQRGSRLAFFYSFWKSWRLARKLFKTNPPHAVLAMGGFTSAPPVMAAKSLGIPTFLHESNTIPGRANRWLARVVNEAFVGFPQAVDRLRARKVTVTGTPVRPQFHPRDSQSCRANLFGTANPEDSVRLLAEKASAEPQVVLVMGGSQGASGINEMVLSALPELKKRNVNWLWVHLTGPREAQKVEQAYANLGFKAVVRPFLAEMEVAMGAATVCISRAGASSLAELAAMRLPALLVPYPFATDDHQLHNARAFVESGAARLLEQREATPERVADLLVELVESAAVRTDMESALSRWHFPDAAERIAGAILQVVGEPASSAVPDKAKDTVTQPSGSSKPSSTNQQEVICAGVWGSWILASLSVMEQLAQNLQK